MMKAIFKLIVIVFFCLQTSSLYGLCFNNGLNNGPESNDTTEAINIEPDDPVLVMLDSLAKQKVFQNLDSRKESTTSPINDFSYGFVPEYSDSVYKERLEELNNLSPIELEYNSLVKSFIDVYNVRRRELTERILGLAELYFPYFEQQLDRYDLPLELKYIAVIESALNPVARSWAGATGIWQFMYGTGRLYGLNVNSYVDDRCDIIKSTQAACEHFADLYDVYDDWLLAIAAYNSGAGNVNRAIRRSGGVKDFWSIRGFLPRETRNYVPAFMAVAYVIEYSDHHNLYPTPPPFTNTDIDTLHINRKLSLRNVSKILDIPLEHLRYLNPSFRKNIIPGNDEDTYVFRIPSAYSGLFVSNEEEIYNYMTPEEIRQEELAAQFEETTVHVVRQGEVLGSIARRYGCTVNQIQRWNNLRGTLIRPGQRLVVRAPQPAETNISTDNNVHVVRSGESLGVIANRYRVTVDELKRWNDLSGSTIYSGQHLVVKPAEGKEDKETKESREGVADKAEIEEYTYKYYQIQDGDTLRDIAEKYPETTIDQIREINDLSNDALKPGEKIKISVQEE